MFQHGFTLTDRIAASSGHIDTSCRHGGPSLERGKGLNASVVRCLWPTRYQDHGRMRCAILSGQWGDICWQRLAGASPGLAQVRLNQQGLGQRANWAFRNPSPWSFWKVSWPTNPASIQPIVPRYSSSSLCQALITGTEGPGRWYGGMAYPFLYPFPASISRLLRRRFQNAQARFYLYSGGYARSRLQQAIPRQ